MSRPYVMVLAGLALAGSMFGGGKALAAAPAEDPKLPVCVSLSVAGLDADQLCKK